MAISSIGTSSSLQTATFDLLELAADISEHVNSSLTKAHAVNVISNNYYDSGGDLYGNYVLRLVVQGTVVYVPAQMPDPDPGPGSQEILPSLISLTQSLVGSPSPGFLISPVASGYASQVSGLINTLLLHATLNHDVAHSGMVLIAGDPTLDNLGHVVARNKISVSINGQTYYIPCDTSPSGPPGPIQFGKPAFWSSPQGESSGIFSNGSNFGAVAHVWAASAVANQQITGGFLGGSTIGWSLQVSKDAQNWVTFTASGPGSQFIGAGTGSQPIVRVGGPPSGVLNQIPTPNGYVSVPLQFFDTDPSTNDRGTPNFYFRFVFTTSNSGIVIFSRVINALIAAGSN